jgi:hypothetical protein
MSGAKGCRWRGGFVRRTCHALTKRFYGFRQIWQLWQVRAPFPLRSTPFTPSLISFFLQREGDLQDLPLRRKEALFQRLTYGRLFPGDLPATAMPAM